MQFIAMRGRYPVVEGDDLDQVVKNAEDAVTRVKGDIVVWDSDKFIVVEIEWTHEGPATFYTKSQCDCEDDYTDEAEDD